MKRERIVYLAIIALLVTALTASVSMLTAGAYSQRELEKFDLNGDSTITVNDVTLLLDFLGGKYQIPLRNGLYVVGTGNVRLYEDDQYLTGFQTYNGRTMYFEPETGFMVTENQIINGKLHIFERFVVDDLVLYEVHEAKQGFYKESGRIRHYVDDVLTTGWYDFEGNLLYFYKSTGNLLISEGGVTLGGAVHYFETFTYGSLTLCREREMRSGFIAQDGGVRYYVNDAAQSGFVTVDGNTYYFDPDTKLMVTENRTIDGVRYSFEPYAYNSLNLYRAVKNGIAETSEGVRYYVSDVMQTGFVVIDEKKVYFDLETGLMQSDVLEVNGRLYDTPTPFTYDGVTLYAYGDPVPSSGLEFSLNDEGTEFTLTDIGTCTETSIQIPASYLGKPVTAIGDRAFADQTQITEVLIPDTVTSIGTRAFYNTGITEITIPSSVTSIGTQPFYKANNLKTVYYNSTYCPSNNTANPFLNGASIEKIVFGGTKVPQYAPERMGFQNSVTTVVVAIGKRNSPTSPVTGVALGTYALRNCTSLTDLTICDSVISISKYALSGCTNLKNVVLPDSVRKIDEYAFNGCSALESVTIGDGSYAQSGKSYQGTGTIAQYSFNKCSALASVSIGESMTVIDGNAFYSCSGLTTVTLGSRVASIGLNAFYHCPVTRVNYTGTLGQWCQISFAGNASNPLYQQGGELFIKGERLTNAVIPGTVTTINDSAFIGCSSLESAVIPDSVTSIGASAFRGCANLTSVTVGDGTASIGTSAFRECANLTSITLGGGLTSIGSSAFRGCSSLTGAIIPDGVTLIADWTFSECSGMTSVTIGSGVTKINGAAFNGCASLESVTIPASVTSIGGEAFGGCTSLTSVSLPDSLTRIPGRLFGSCSSLKNITIPDSVTSIGESAFFGCTSLESIIIPESVTSIDSRAFHYCPGLESITSYSAYYPSVNNCLIESATGTLITGCKNSVIPTDGSVTQIAEYAFSYCSGLTSITIPGCITEIGSRAFLSCTNLTNVTIPESVTTIGEGAFSSDRNLTTVLYGGTAEQWSQIRISSGNVALTSAQIIYNYTGD